MFRPQLIPGAADDPGFCHFVARIIGGATAVYKLTDIRIFKIDNWFDHKWLRFSGTIVQHVAVWKDPTTIPPFVPNRVVWQEQYLKEEGLDDYVSKGPGPLIHLNGRSTANLFRRAAEIAPGSGLFWFSGNSLVNGRGSLMGYLPVQGRGALVLVCDARADRFVKGHSPA